MTETHPREAAISRVNGDVVCPAGGGSALKPAAVYDDVTDGLTGRQFLFTGRWVAFIGAAVAFAIVCSLLALWQFDRGQAASADNAIITANFDATPVPVSRALPATDFYRANQNWQRVSATGTYQAGDQLFVRNRFRGDAVGFEVLTPLRMSNGRTLIVDRGWIASSSSDSNVPAKKPAPPDGSVSVVARLQKSEPARGAGRGENDQIQSVDLSTVKDRIGGDVYTGAFGVLDTQTPPSALKAVQPTPPAEGVGFHYSYMVQWIFFALIGFFLLARGIRNEFRRINADDPEERERAEGRMKKAAKKPFTDEETEDEILDGYLPLGRWGFGSSALPSAREHPHRALDAARGELGAHASDTGAFLIDPQRGASAPDEAKKDQASIDPAHADRTHADRTHAAQTHAAQTDPSGTAASGEAAEGTESAVRRETLGGRSRHGDDL